MVSMDISTYYKAIAKGTDLHTLMEICISGATKENSRDSLKKLKGRIFK
jgi:hypothetical protein